MSKRGRFENEARFGITDSLHKKILAIQQLRGEEYLADVYRSLLEEAANRVLIEESLDMTLPMIRQAVRDQLKPMEERFAKILAKQAVAAATTMYLNNQLISDNGHDHELLYTESRKRAAAFVKSNIMNDYIRVATDDDE